MLKMTRIALWALVLVALWAAFVRWAGLARPLLGVGVAVIVVVLVLCYRPRDPQDG